MTTPGGVSGISSSASKRVRSDSEESDSEEGNSFESDVESEIQIIASSSSSSTVGQNWQPNQKRKGLTAAQKRTKSANREELHNSTEFKLSVYSKSEDDIRLL